MCYFTYDIMDLHMPNLVTLVPLAPCSVLYAAWHQFTEIKLIMWCFIRFNFTYTQGPDKYILTPRIMCSQQLRVLR